MCLLSDSGISNYMLSSRSSYDPLDVCPTHYAWWVHVHIRDTVQLDDTHRDDRDAYSHFLQCYFTAQISAQVLSSIVLDQNHEQLNRLIKRDGGAVGITKVLVHFLDGW